MENIMKTFTRKMIAGVFATICFLSMNLASADNEVLIEQVGDNLTLTILQAGYGNSLSGNTSQSADLTLTGASLIVDLIQDGNLNEMFGSWIADGDGTAVLDFYFQGDSNIWDMNMGASGSADYNDILSNVVGSTNLFDIDIGGNAAAESNNMDLIILGDRNDFSTSFTNSKVWAAGSGNNATGTQTLSGIVIDSSNNVWNFDITGDDNAFATKQASNDGNSMIVEYEGSDGDFQLIQNMTSTCTPACAGVINLEIDSENASVSVVQQD